MHYGHYLRVQLFEDARRRRVCAYPADYGDGPLAVEEILLSGCSTIDGNTGASFATTGETVVLDEDERPPSVYLDGIRHKGTRDRGSVRQIAAEKLETDRITEDVFTALYTIRLRGSIASMRWI